MRMRSMTFHGLLAGTGTIELNRASKNKMASGRESTEDGLSMLKFWILFVVGLVVVLSLFRGFMGGVENAKLRDREAERGVGGARVKRKSRRGQGKKSKEEHHQPSSSSEHEHKD